MLFSF
jgi:hypothetical protein